jgi:hypothetical protein
MYDLSISIQLSTSVRFSPCYRMSEVTYEFLMQSRMLTHCDVIWTVVPWSIWDLLLLCPIKVGTSRLDM